MQRSVYENSEVVIKEGHKLSTTLDVSGLYAIGGLLLVILGISGIFLRKRHDMDRSIGSPDDLLDPHIQRPASLDSAFVCPWHLRRCTSGNGGARSHGHVGTYRILP